jgi:hypothetical protein
MASQNHIGDFPILPAIGCAAVLAMWCGLGRLHYVHNADSLLLVLVSLQKWTPFFWHQDRYGMLVPLLARPIHDPLLNLLFQGWLTTTAGILAPFLLAVFFGVRRGTAAVAGLATALLLFVMKPVTRLDWLVSQPYGLSLSLGFGGLLFAERRDAFSIASSVVFLSLAHWVNLGVVLVLAPAVALRWRPRALLPLATAVGVGILIQHVGGPTELSFGATDTGVAPTQLLRSWKSIASGAAIYLSHPTVTAVMAGISLLGLWRVPSSSGLSNTGIRAMALTALVYFVATASIRHVAANDFNIRYFYPALVMCLTVTAALVCGALHAHPRLRDCASGAMLVVAVAQAFGAPAPMKIEKTLDMQFGDMTAVVVTTNASVIAGSYWSVWPAVFHANLSSYRRSSSRQVYGLAYRSDVTDGLWSAGHERVRMVARSNEDADVRQALAHLPVPFHLVGRLGRFSLFETDK